MWSIIWFVIVVDSPENDPHLTEKERMYIEDSLKDDHVSRKVRNKFYPRSVLSNVCFCILSPLFIMNHSSTLVFKYLVNFLYTATHT